MGEAELLQMALGNVLDNALDFAPAGSEVRVSLRVEGGECGVSVQDQGPGVPDYALARLGERFYSTPRPAGAGQTERKGSGLGLAIAQQIMALHGGHIDWANTQPGLRVTLRFKDFTLASPSTSPPHLP
jgi:two-component system sensor histidine kinase CreC